MPTRPPTPRSTPLRAPQRRRLPSRAGTTTTSVSLPHDLHRRAVEAALERNWVFREVVRVALVEWLDRHGARRGKGART
jgi:hypothetical protein